MAQYVSLTPGDPAPWFKQRTTGNPRYTFDTAAGRYIVLCLLGSAGNAHGRAAVEAALGRPTLFDDATASFFGVTFDPEDERGKRVADRYPGYRWLWDLDGTVGRLYGALPVDAKPGQGGVRVRRLWIVLDPSLRVLRVVPFAEDRSDIAATLDFVASLPPPARHAGFEVQAPILLLPNVFEAELCERLVGLYEAHGGEESGFMREVDGRTVLVTDPAHKRRRDHHLSDKALISEIQGRFKRRVVPMIERAHQFRTTRMERHVVACYAAEDGAHFRAHRDNTTKGTAHRRFAVSINLNADFDGGEISFPEFGTRSFKPPVGGAVVFSCSLLHAVSKVTRGRRYAYLPFLYDDEAARLREANIGFLGDGSARYSSGLAGEAPEQGGDR